MHGELAANHVSLRPRPRPHDHRSPQGPQPGWAWRSSGGGGGHRTRGHGLAPEDQTPGASRAQPWKRAPLQVRTQLPPTLPKSTIHRRGQGLKQQPGSCKQQTPPTLTCPRPPPTLTCPGPPPTLTCPRPPKWRLPRGQVNQHFAGHREGPKTGARNRCSPDKYPSPKKPTKSETWSICNDISKTNRKEPCRRAGIGGL